MPLLPSKIPDSPRQSPTLARPQNRNLRRGGAGKQKGTKHKRTLAAEEFARAIVDRPEYRARLVARIDAGKAPHMEPLLCHYVFGKPRDTVVHEGEIQVKLSEAADAFKRRIARLAAQRDAGDAAGDAHDG